jgi:hypothetical protein
METIATLFLITPEANNIHEKRKKHRENEVYYSLYSAVEITKTMHKFAPLIYSYMLAPTFFGSSLPSSGSFWIRLSYLKIQIDMAVYHIMWLSGL